MVEFHINYGSIAQGYEADPEPITLLLFFLCVDETFADYIVKNPALKSVVLLGKND